MVPDKATIEAMRKVGLHYDREKNKYFKIAPNSDKLAYSIGNVQNQNTRDERKRQVEATSNKNKGQIKRSPILEDIPGDFLSRAHGLGKVDGPKIYAAGLSARFCTAIPFGEEANDSVMCIEPKPDLGTSMVHVNVGSMGAILSGFLRPTNEKKACSVSASKESTPWINTGSGGSEKARRIYFVGRGPATSLSANAYRRQMAMTWFSSTFAAGIALVSMSPGPEEPNNLGILTAVILGPGTPDEDPRAEIDVLCSTAAPPSSEYMFVFGTSHGIMTLDTTGRRLQRIPTSPRTTQTPSWNVFEKDILAVNFLDNDPNTLMSGNRAGLLTITDFREAAHSGSNSFRHPSGITHIRSINSHQVVVAGLKSKMCLYDQRFVKRFKECGPLKSTPVVTYPEYYNESMIRHGFDVDVETGIIAVAQEPHVFHDAIQLFSIRDGCALDTPSISSVTRGVKKEVQKDIYSALQIVEDEPSGAKSIWGLRRDHLDRFGWHGLDDD